MTEQPIFKVTFHNQGQVYEVFVREVGQSSMYGFLELEDFVFGERSSIVVDPSEEKLKTEFKNVKRTYVPMHAIIRIDEVEKQGVSKITKLDGTNVTPFPVPMYSPTDTK